MWPNLSLADQKGGISLRIAKGLVPIGSFVAFLIASVGAAALELWASEFASLMSHLANATHSVACTLIG